MSYIETNRSAIQEFEKSAGEIREAFQSRVVDQISYLKLCGLVCSECGKKNITYPILRFFDFEPTVKCYDCQKV